MSYTLHPMRRRRLHRSASAVPGSSMEMIQKSATSAADVVFLDCEDAVSPPEKEAARRNIIAALNEIDWQAHGKTVSLRITGFDAPSGHRDLVEIMEQAGDQLDTILVPKVGAPADLYAVESLISQIEQAMGFTNRVGTEALIDTARGMANVAAIAASGGRLEALHFGVADAAISLGARGISTGGLNPDDPGDQRHMALSRMIVTCRAYGLRAIDGPFGDFSDPDGYLADARRAAVLGIEGKWAVHPRQIALANAVFTPPPAEVERARRIIAAMRAAEAEGKGAAGLDGTMIDAASQRMAANVIAIDDAITARPAQASAA
ncbi:MAG: CoA ester lyase [Pseudomonadota bacterium]